MGDRHVYGARSRFMTDAVIKCCEPVAFGSYLETEDSSNREKVTLDVASRLKGMWA
jgi:DNA helicase-2/ATP-dependent DNA helicase PcrA